MGRSAVPITAVAVAFMVAVAAAWQLPRSFLPPFNEGTLTINLLLNPGISLTESNRVGTLAEKLIMRVPEVRRVGRRTGRAELDEHAAGVHSSELDVDLRSSDRTRTEIMQDVRNRLSALPVLVNVGQPISHRLDHMLSGIRAEIAVKIFGDNIDTLRTLANSLAVRLSSIRGLADLQVEKQVRIPQIQIRFDYQRAIFYGVSPGVVTEVLENLSNGRLISHVLDGNKRFNVVMRLADSDRTADKLAKLMVETSVGRVPLRSFTDIIETDGPNQIMRENGQRRIVVLTNTDGSDISEIVSKIRSEIDRFHLPPGYFVDLEGTFRAQEEGARVIAGLSLVSLCLIFLVLYNRYRSSALALIIMGNVPLALIGSVVALWIVGQPLSLASMIGFITLAGISTRNGILKISQYINLALHEGETFGEKLIIRGSQERLTPVLMTALAAGFALIPLLIGADAPGKEILHPVAVVIFGGLISATLLDAVLTPVLFRIFGAKPLQRLQRQQVETGTTLDTF
jgi:HME family heavy-metal exporter